MKDSIKVNESFKPHPDLKELYYAYLAIGATIFYLSWAIPVSVLIFINLRPIAAIAAFTFLFLPLLAIISFTVFWIPRFYSSLSYLFTESDIIIQKGVWWKRKSIVPYNRVTNIDVIQGPLSRFFGLGKVSIQTAGFSSGGSSGSARIAEAVILGIKNFESVKDFILSRVKRFRPIAVEAETEQLATKNVSMKILEELKKIRKSLEKPKKRR